MLETFKQYFHEILHPEILTRKFDINNEKDRKVYCFCRRTSFEILVACDCSTCSYEWFYYGCVYITRAPKGGWFCSDCSKKQTKKMIRFKNVFKRIYFCCTAWDPGMNEQYTISIDLFSEYFPRFCEVTDGYFDK